ncbi:hypothetical protein [Flavobacterium phragmitis]|uniref:Uncharacterized protein n=1 Tax=Flavobacterium phragmitis TaxID=739143 RepID=A0A1I1S2Q4_9FLAO|nr:hypothetical protein [Flavobacterium phragmitis]SFD38053.1 hypothetical protein SAMN05216297_107169 [Flavobacterium phragmitis]
MSKLCHLKQLSELAPILSIAKIQLWLEIHKEEFYNAIDDSECRKWSKWLNANEKPFPCVCSERVQNCIFIEAYYKLSNALDLYRKQECFTDLVAKYQSIKNSKEEFKAFASDLDVLGFNLSFNPKIVISPNSEPYEKIVFQLNVIEFRVVIEFQELLLNHINL